MNTIQLPNYLYKASQILLILLTTVCFAISAADVIIQALSDKTSSGQFDYRNMVVIAGSYLLLAIATFLFSCSRLLTVKSSLQDIPKLYMPIKEEDLPKKVYLKIRDQFKETNDIRQNAIPRAEDIQAEGWGKPGGFQGFNFKKAAVKTASIIEDLAGRISNPCVRPVYESFPQFVERLISHGIVHPQYGSMYVKWYEYTRFSNKQLSEDEFKEIMRCLALVVQSMGFIPHNDGFIPINDTPNNHNQSIFNNSPARHSSPRSRLPQRQHSSYSNNESISRSTTTSHSRSIRHSPSDHFVPYDNSKDNPYFILDEDLNYYD